MCRIVECRLHHKRMKVVDMVDDNLKMLVGKQAQQPKDDPQDNLYSLVSQPIKHDCTLHGQRVK